MLYPLSYGRMLTEANPDSLANFRGHFRRDGGEGEATWMLSSRRLSE